MEYERDVNSRDQGAEGSGEMAQHQDSRGQPSCSGITRT